MVPWSRSTKPLVQQWRGLVRVWRMRSSEQRASKRPLNSLPRSVRTRWSFQPAFTVGRQQDALEEARAVDRFHRGDDLREGEGAGGVAGCDLPELAHALELADVEGVQADQLAGNLRFDVARAAVAGLPEATTRALGKQTGRSSAVVFDNGQPLMARGEAAAPKQAMDGAGSHTHLTSGQLR